MTPDLTHEQLERVLLGTCLSIRDKYILVLDIIKSPKYFASKANADIFAAILALSQDSKPIDIVTVSDYLTKYDKYKGELTPFYVADTSSISAYTDSHIVNHAEQLRESYLSRGIDAIVSEFSQKDPDNPKTAEETYVELISKLDELVADSEVSLEQSLQNSIIDAIKIMEKVNNADGKLTGVDTGFIELNRRTAGWQNSDLIILAAATGMGKTAAEIQFALEAAKAGNHVAVFSCEMSTRQLINRLLSQMTGINLEKFVKGGMEPHEWEIINEKSSYLSKLPIYIDDRSSLSIHQIKLKCKTLKHKSGLGLVVIDYLQLLQGKGKDIRERINNITRDAKIMAKELDVPVILLSQLSRAVEKNHDSIPALGNLKESGNIEQDADMVVFVYRPAYYDITNKGESGDIYRGNEAYLMIAKFRNGVASPSLKQAIELEWVGENAKFIEPVNF